MVDPILVSPIFRDFILPFVLVFTLVFALLEKTQLLGDGKRQINAIIGLVIGLIVISFSYATGIIVTLMPFLSVFAVVILIFMMLYGFASGKKDSDILNKQLKVTFGILIGLGLIAAVLYSTGWWVLIYEYVFSDQMGGQIFVNLLLIVVIIAAIIAVVAPKSKDSSKSS
jgi:hypothetical protein